MDIPFFSFSTSVKNNTGGLCYVFSRLQKRIRFRFVFCMLDLKTIFVKT